MFTYGRLTPDDAAMMASNIFLLSPVIIAGAYGEWTYLFFASGIIICSMLFHWYRITAHESRLFWSFRVADWMFATGAFIYMYYYVHTHFHGILEVSFSILLSLTLIFFLYGWRYGNYRLFHPWFHFIAPAISSAILLIAHP